MIFIYGGQKNTSKGSLSTIIPFFFFFLVMRLFRNSSWKWTNLVKIPSICSKVKHYWGRPIGLKLGILLTGIFACDHFHLWTVTSFLSVPHLRDISRPFERSPMAVLWNSRELIVTRNLCPQCCRMVWSDGYCACISGWESRWSWYLQWMSSFY